MRQDTVIATIAQDNKILTIENFISDDQYQRVIIEAKKKSCRTKLMSRGEAKAHMDFNKPVVI